MHSISRRLLVAFAVGLATVGLGGAARAASFAIDVSSDAHPIDGPGPGDQIFVTLVGTIDPGDAASFVQLDLSYDPILVFPIGLSVTVDPVLAGSGELTSFGGGLVWTTGGTQGDCSFSSGSCRILSQLAGSVLEPDQTSATMVMEFSQDNIGYPSFSTSGDFFGASHVDAQLVPEPATGSLLGFGLAAWGVASRGRQARARASRTSRAAQKAA